jgi:hypothetical protein
MELAYLDIPFSLEYHFSKKKISPFAQLGINLGVPLKREVTEKQFMATPQELSQQPKATFSGSGFGFGGGIGVKIRSKEKMTLQFLGQYTRFSTLLIARSTLFGDGNIDLATIFLSRVQLGGTLVFRM